jgi:hypothetical protein
MGGSTPSLTISSFTSPADFCGIIDFFDMNVCPSKLRKSCTNFKNSIDRVVMVGYLPPLYRPLLCSGPAASHLRTAGFFDPPTFGSLEIISRALSRSLLRVLGFILLFDKDFWHIMR